MIVCFVDFCFMYVLYYDCISIVVFVSFILLLLGHCGHTSPCEQLCYEIHDGMYECDCIEGYELNKNGYSCQGTYVPSNSHSLSRREQIQRQLKKKSKQFKQVNFISSSCSFSSFLSGFHFVLFLLFTFPWLLFCYFWFLSLFFFLLTLLDSIVMRGVFLF